MRLGLVRTLQHEKGESHTGKPSLAAPILLLPRRKEGWRAHKTSQQHCRTAGPCSAKNTLRKEVASWALYRFCFPFLLRPGNRVSQGFQQELECPDAGQLTLLPAAKAHDGAGSHHNGSLWSRTSVPEGQPPLRICLATKNLQGRSYLSVTTRKTVGKH